MAEKFGFVGMISIFLVYGLLLFRLVSVVISAPTTYLRLVSGGIFAWMSVQAFVNVGAMLGIMPLTGVTLPLLSFGGTSLIFTMAALGVAFNISRYTKYVNETPERQEHEDSTSGRRIGRTRYAS
jgi:cell division protein FtsW